MAAPRSGTVIKVFSSLHQFWYRVTGGRLGSRINGMDVLLLTTKGRRTGKARTTPLQYLRDGDTYVVVASNAGRDQPPAWWLNLKNSSTARVQVKADTHAVRAEEVSDAERARLWPLLTAAYNDYGVYAHATSRHIPVVILRPDGAGQTQ